MSDINTTYAGNRTITAFFDDRTAAQKASDDLAAIGVPRSQIQITDGSKASGAATQSPDKGFWEELKDLFLPAEDRYGYAEGLRRGGYLLSAQVNDAAYDRAMGLLDREGAVDMDEREASWKTSGWTGYQAEPTTPVAGAGAANTRSAVPSPSKATSASTQLQTGGDEVIPVYEETAKIGKRDVSHGRVRLRSYVIETPVSEQVNLRSEQVQVERRPVDRPVATSDAVFQDLVVEAEERAEEAVIAKETRVKEEIALRKNVVTQAQTVSDTVRRTEVDVQDDRSGGATRGFMASSDSGLINSHMDVIASDGVKIGAVDHLDGDRVKLTKSASPDGQHHYVPLAWIDHVDAHVHLNRSASQAKAGW